MNFWANAVGFVALVVFLLGYLQKKRSNILLLNLISRILYIVQYIMLGALAGAVLDVAGALATVFAQRKNSPFIKRHLKLVIIAVNIAIIASGIYVMIVAEDKFGFLPILGVMLHTNAFWLDDEKKIRRLSIIGSPFWLVYNFVSAAYFSCVGDILSIASLGLSMYRYDRKSVREKTEKK